ncbi:MAG: MATE family efflux transporter, partial [Treponema sp.]|nr:MATE family efflux transporter [Treponema sp.]
MAESLFTSKDLKRLILPLVAEQFLAMTIGACDTVMVASIGEAGVSGVSLIDQLTQLFIQLFAAFATGGAVV